LANIDPDLNVLAGIWRGAPAIDQGFASTDTGVPNRHQPGEDGSLVAGKISERGTCSYWHDAQEGEYGDLVSGIIDPTKWSGPRCRMQRRLRDC
jgi:hypothetical protein